MPDTIASDVADQGQATLGFSAYRTLVSQSVIPLDLFSDSPDTFRGQLDARGSGDIHILHIRADQHAVNRSHALVSRDSSKYYKFSLVLRGNGLIVQEGRETPLGAGDMAIYDTDRPYSLVFAEAVHMGVVMFPKQLIELPAEVVTDLTARRFSGDEGIGAIVKPYLTQLVAQSDGLDGHVARRLARSAVDLVGTLLEEHASVQRSARGHDAITRRVLDYIDENLCSPGLCPAQIAAAHYISVRHLRALFSELGTSVSSLIRTRRLERAYDELVSPTYADRSVSAIAAANGFVDPAHFSRTFRARYGIPPSALRPSPK